MSTSTVSINPNPTISTRRRPVEKKSTPLSDAILATPPQPTPLPNDSNTVRFDNRDPVVKRKTTPQSDAVLNNSVETANRRVGKKAVKSPKPKWLTVARILTKNVLFLMVLWGLVQIVRRVSDKGEGVSSRDGITVISADLDGKFAAMDDFVKKSSRMMQVQIDLIDRKLEKEIGSVREELKTREGRFEDRLREVREGLEKEIGGRVETLLSKEEFEGFIEEYLKGKETGRDGDDVGVSLDDVRVYAKEVVEREIEKHASDGLGRVDFALSSGGARVVKHSEPYVTRAGRGFSSILQSSVHPNAEKMLHPSFGEPGMCFPLKGSSGYVIVHLRTAIVPEAVTLEHVAKSVAYDRTSAPKDCRVFGWRDAEAEDSTDLAAENEMFLLSEFTYDLEKSNAQTYNVLDSVGSRVVDTIRFDFTSNHGSSSHTCIYRLRVHGYEPASMLPAES